jgi:hypothetical protein
VDGGWTPPLHVTEVGGRCRLWMSGCGYGEGATLQEAADDLIRRVLGLVEYLRTGASLQTSTDLPHPDPRVVALIYEIGRIAAHGGDIRERLFGASRA